MDQLGHQVNALNTARDYLAAAGTQTAALAFGGTPPVTAATEEYDGTSWTSSTSMTTARVVLAGAGTQASALAFGGYSRSFNSNRRMDRCRFSINSYNHSFLTFTLSFQ
jgi:L-2-hydroxyglutarate oxidase LhgO